MPNYHPEPVPSGNDTAELNRYLQQELNRIADVLNIKTERSYGGLFQSGPAVLITPLSPAGVLFNPFNGVVPERPDGIGFAVPGALIILTGGSYLVQFTTTVSGILPNSAYTFELTVDGVGTLLGGDVQPSNQTEIATVAFSILYDAAKGDIFTIQISSSTSSDALVSGSEFIATRVSESFD